MKDTNAFLKLLSSSYDTRWRDFGILWVYVVANIALAMFWYWLARVPKDKRSRRGRGAAINATQEKVEEKGVSDQVEVREVRNSSEERGGD